ncbi:MAG: efflux RND transporter periplasmic adaptor subunit [Flammeovirgaceae bacterium]
MNTKYFAALLMAGMTAALMACSEGEDVGSLAGKKKLLEKKRQELSAIKSEVDKLEAEIAAMDSSDPKLKLKRVTILPLQAQTFSHFIELQGSVASEQNVNVMPETQGAVIKRFVEEGQYVKEGQPLVELDGDVLRKNIAELETKLDLAKVVFQKQENLWKQKVGTEIQYLQAKNNVESLEKSIATLKTQLSKTIVKSPVSGTVDELFVKEGEMASPMIPVARVVNIDKVEISAEVSEAYAMAVRKGDEVIVKFPTFSLEAPLKVSMVGQQINPVNRSFRIEMQMDNRQLQIKPNATTVVKIKDFEAKNAIIVPAHLIQKSTDGYQFLFTVVREGDKDIVRKTIIETGLSYEGKTHITKGLEASAVLVLDGYNEVVDGEPVNVVANENVAAN